MSHRIEELFAPWPRAQREVSRLALEAPPPPWVLRTAGVLTPDLAVRITDWYTGGSTAPAGAVRASYRALEREAAGLYEAIQRRLGVRVELVHAEEEPYACAAELCAELRRHGSMKLRTIACDAPHPLLDSAEGGIVDRLRVIHDVFGHAALGLGFDVQAEYGTWLQCRTLFSPEARPAAFCELVGAVTAYVVTGEKPALRADIAPVELIAACEPDAALAA